MRLVIIESPYAGDVTRNVAYVKACIKDCIGRGESPFASHALYTIALDDSDPYDRSLGMNCGHAWGKVADATVVYSDLGISEGMKQGIAEAQKDGRHVEYRLIGWNK